MDVLYCGVDKSKILQAKPKFNEESLKLLEHFIIERYKIHVKKDVKKIPPPWTDDPILREYRFTNVRREHDRESRWLIENISLNACLTLEDKVLNSILFRFWNKSQTFKILGLPAHWDEFDDPEQFRPLIEKYTLTHPDYVWFTPAFNTGGGKQTWHYPDGQGYRSGYRSNEEATEQPTAEPLVAFRPFLMMRWLINTNIVDRILSAKDQFTVQNIIMEIPGYANFLGYQVFVDLTYLPEFQFSENEFTVCGPGCKRGIDQIVNDRDGLSYEEILFWMRDHQEELFPNLNCKKLMEDLSVEDRNLNVMSLESLHCEISKYLKVIYKTGRPRNKYKTNDSHPFWSRKNFP